MATKEHDTDPSTPSARRPNKMRSTSPPPPPVDTDPGLAPPPFETDPPSVPLGIKVPSNRPPPSNTGDLNGPYGFGSNDDYPKASKKDSVEILLEGMAEVRLDRSRTTPQTAGQASASYHAEHQLRASERPPPAPPDEPKVLLDQPPTVTMRLDRLPPRAGVADPTWIRPQQTAWRVFVALGAGLAVVVAIFLWLQAASRSRDGVAKTDGARVSSPVANAPATVAPPSPPPVVAPPVVAPAPAETATAAVGSAEAVAPSASAAALNPASSASDGRSAGKNTAGHASLAGAASAGHTDGHGNSGHRKGNSAAAAPTDLGEFKTTY